MHGYLPHPTQVLLCLDWHVHQEFLVLLPHVDQRIVGKEVPRGQGLLLHLSSRLDSLLDLRVFIDEFLSHSFLPLDLLVQNNRLESLIRAAFFNRLGLALSDYSQVFQSFLLELFSHAFYVSHLRLSVLNERVHDVVDCFLKRVLPVFWKVGKQLLRPYWFALFLFCLRRLSGDSQRMCFPPQLPKTTFRTLPRDKRRQGRLPKISRPLPLKVIGNVFLFGVGLIDDLLKTLRIRFIDLHSFYYPSQALQNARSALDVWLALPCNNNSRMLFEDDSPEDKGLFTFYREQAEREEQIRREKKLRKRRREEQVEADAVRVQEAAIEESKSKSKKVDSKNCLMPKATLKVLPPRQPKPNPTKQRLLESIVNMGKEIEPEQDLLTDRNNINTLRLRQPSHLLKSRRFREKLNELSHMEQQQTGRQVQMIDQMHIQSLHKRNQSEELGSGRLKQVIHSGRGSVQLPDIHKPQEAKMTHRPKKSMKSQLIQQALHSRDRDKIKQIRNYLRYQSPSKEEQLQPDEMLQERQLDDKSFEVFGLRQQKLMSILKRFRKGV